MSKPFSPRLLYLVPLVAPGIFIPVLLSPGRGLLIGLVAGGVTLIFWLAARLKPALPSGHQEAALLSWVFPASPLVMLLALDTYTYLTGGYATQGGHAPIGQSLAMLGWGLVALSLHLAFWLVGVLAALWGLYQLQRGRPYLTFTP